MWCMYAFMPFSSDMSVFCSTWWWITTWVVTSWLFSASLRTVYQRTWPDSTWRRWFWRSILCISCTMFTGETILLTDLTWFCLSFSLFWFLLHDTDIWNKLHGNNLCVLAYGNVNSFGNTGSDQIVLISAITGDILVLPLAAQLLLRCIRRGTVPGITLGGAQPLRCGSSGIDLFWSY